MAAINAVDYDAGYSQFVFIGDSYELNISGERTFEYKDILIAFAGFWEG